MGILKGLKRILKGDRRNKFTSKTAREASMKRWGTSQGDSTPSFETQDEYVYGGEELSHEQELREREQEIEQEHREVERDIQFAEREKALTKKREQLDRLRFPERYEEKPDEKQLEDEEDEDEGLFA